MKTLDKVNYRVTSLRNKYSEEKKTGQTQKKIISCNVFNEIITRPKSISK